MSERTYRIKVTHDPGQPHFGQWSAQVFRVSDDAYMEGSSKVGETPEEVTTMAQAWIKSQNERVEPFDVFTDDEGRIVSESVKA